jgi:dTDP-4-amino-4,6-dideoxygalactose transaminase
VKAPPTDRANEHIFHQYTLRVERRDALQAFLKERAIGSGGVLPAAVASASPASPTWGTSAVACRHEAAPTRCFSLPIYPELSRAQLDWVVESIRAFYA